MASKRRGPYGKRKYDAETIEGSNEGLTVLNETICKYEERLSRSDQNRPPSGPKNTPVTTNEEYAGCSYETKENLMGGNEIDVMDIEQEDIQSDSESIIYTHDLPESETLPLFGDENDLDNQSYDTADMNLNVDQLDLDSEPLYPGASVTVGAIMLLLAVFCTSNNLSGESIQQLLSIFAVTLPNGHRLCSSLNGFKNFFRNLKNPIVKHYYCGYCLGFIADASAVNCPYGKCYRPLSENLEYFLEMPVDEQLKGLFSQKGYYNAVQERFVRENERTYRDIFDGKLYQSYVENNGPLSSPDNISFTFNTDGASVFRSSNTSVWPLFLVINELPYRLRMKRDNMILAGLWFGNKKPSMGTFLQPFLEKFKEFEKGFHIYSPERGDFLMKAFIICGTADLPARCLLCNGIQYNGSFSCWKCIQSGETAKKGGGHCHVFPFIEENPKLPERSKQSVLVDSKLALDKQDAGIRKYTVNGVKGPSWLSFFPKFNIVDGIAIDYMHGVLLGVQKLLLELWFSASHKGKPYSYADQVCEADRRLLSIKPTLNISRLPRSIQNELKYWKASEYRSFLLYYGAVVLKGILDQERFVHYLYFVNAIHILLKFDASLTEINRADILLLEFVKLFSRHYGKCFMTLNLHQLVHLADSVRTLGPLYTHSCFPFEDKNGVLLKMIRGTQNIDSQIITGVSFLQKLPELKRKTIEKDSELEQLYISIECPNILKRGLKIDSGIYVLGALHTRSLTEGEHFSLCTSIGYDVPHEKVQSFKRLELHEDLIYGTSYSRMNKRDNSVICYKKMSDDLTSEFFGRVKDFVIIEENSDLKFNVFAIVEELQCRYENGSFITSVEKTEQVNAVPLMSVLGSCMLISYTSAYRFILLFFNCLLTFGSYFCFDMPSVLQDTFTGTAKSDCPVGNTTCNITCDDCLGMSDDNYNLLYAIYAWTNALVVIGAGFLIDKLGNRVGLFLFSFLVVVGSCTFAAGAMLKGTKAMLPVMLLGRLLFGSGNGSMTIVQNRLTAYWFKNKELAMAFGITLAFSRLGSVLNFFLTQNFEAQYGLGWTLWGGALLCGLGFVSAIIVSFLDIYGVKQLGDADNLRTESKKVRVTDIRYFSLSYWLLALTIMFFYNGVFPFVADSSKFIAKKYKFSDQTSAYISGSVYDVSMILSPFLGGLIDVLGKRGYLAFGCAFLTIPVFGLLAFTDVYPLVSTLWLGMTYSIAAASLWPSIPLVVSQATVGTAMGLTTSIQMVGIGISNLVVGQILGKNLGLTDEQTLERWKYVMVFLLGNTLACVLTSLFLNINDRRKGGILNLSKKDKERAQDLISTDPGKSPDASDDETEPLLRHRKTIN